MSNNNIITMRELLKKTRNYDNNNIISNDIVSKNDNNMTMRRLLKITRRLNEIVRYNKKTIYDQKYEENKFIRSFNDLNVVVKFIELEIYDDYVFWGGTINGVIQFVYKVTPNENTSGVEFNYLEGFSSDNPENDKIIERVKKYYDEFYKYWKNNILQK